MATGSWVPDSTPEPDDIGAGRCSAAGEAVEVSDAPLDEDSDIEPSVVSSPGFVEETLFLGVKMEAAELEKTILLFFVAPSIGHGVGFERHHC